MQSNLTITKKELVDRTAEILANKVYADSSAPSNGASTVDNEEEEPANGRRRRRRAKKASRESFKGKLRSLIQARGPLRVVEMTTPLGLSQSVTNKVVAEMMNVDGTLKEVREGRMIRYDLTRGASAARKTALKPGKKKRAGKKKRGAKKKRAAKKVSVPTEAAAT